ncbi:MAG TPA: hypothetical protein VJU87_05080 [Gemmatimonadaceae bacterium]|nr:hypothetical protein [Gemmatimonadaceae bacterium]
MPSLTEVPTPAALADLVARCNEIRRYATELTAAEELRIAALASGILAMRHVLGLEALPHDQLPRRQGHIEHWVLTGPVVDEALTPAIRNVPGLLLLDEHAQVKILGQRRTWRGVSPSITLWRDGVEGLRANALMDYLARLVSLAQHRAPEVARSLLERSEAVVATEGLTRRGPRASRGD